MRSQARVWLWTVVCGVLLAALVAAPALAAEVPVVEKLVATNCKSTHETCGQEEVEEAEEFDGVKTKFFEPKAAVTTTEAKNEGFTNAGGRVPFGITDFKVLTIPGQKYPNKEPTLRVTHIRTDVAPGLATNPFAVPQCSLAGLGEEPAALKAVHEFGFFEAPKAECGESILGKNEATVFGGPFKDMALSGSVYNIVPQASETMANGAHLASLYGVALKLPKPFTEAVLNNALKGALGKPIEEAQYYAHTLIKGNVEWGTEARGTNKGDFHDYFEIAVNPELPLVRSRLVFKGTLGHKDKENEGDFITNPENCSLIPVTSVKVRDAESVESPAKPFESPIPLEGCNLIEFPITFGLASGSNASEQPNQFTATASEEHEPKGSPDVSQVKSASFTLPEGMTLNPSAANVLTACTEAQAHQAGTVFGEPFGVECPSTSKIGTVTLNVPTLEETLTGSVYLGAPNTGVITGPPYKIYVVANSEKYGVSVRLLGETEPNKETGRVTTYFKNPPEQPFTNLAIHFERGALAPIANPLICGTPEGTATFEPVSAPGTTVNRAFGVSVVGCASAPPPFNPAQSTANSNGNGGQSTQFTFNLARNDGEQYVSTVKTTLPPGLVGKIPAAERCSATAAESETLACPAGSQIGTATVLAGSGPQPFTFNGPVYLTNKVQGAPYGLSIKVPAVAGPFNLGAVVTIAKISVVPTTGQVVVESTLPTIRSGIPFRIKTIKVAVTKSGFMLNPTNCGKLETVSTVGGFATLPASTGTASKSLSSPFQVANCGNLKFKPKFSASSNSRISRVNGAMLTTTITMPSGEANIKSVKVQLPRNLPSRLTTLQKACLAAVFNSNPYHCPSGAYVGSATVKTPTLPSPLHGAAILVSHAGAAFPDLDLVLDDPNGLRVILVGNTNIKSGITTTTFASNPDVPVSSVTVTLPTGPHSAVAAFGGLCAKPLVMPTTMVAQNGKTFKQNTIINVAGCGVQVVGRKVVGNALYLTVRSPEAGRISAGGNGLNTVFRRASKAHQVLSLKVPLSAAGRRRGRPFKVNVRIGFVPKRGHNKVSFTQVTFR